jgi:haloalkane dehalogenase
MPVVSDAIFRLGGFPQNVLTLTQGNPRSILGKVSRAYRYPLRRIRDRIAPLALARMVPDSHEHQTIAALEECQAFVEGYRGPAAIVWGDRDPILGRVRRHIESLLPQATVTRTSAGHFLQEEVPEDIAAAIRKVAARIDA